MADIHISVIIPTCHRNDLLTKCLDCLAPGAQTLPADLYEVIVTDDGSKSTAEAMVHEQYPWARWVAGPKKGSASNRNNGSNTATGGWLAFIDDDCIPCSNWLAAYSSAVISGTYVFEGKTTCNEGIYSPMMEAPLNLKGGLFNSCNVMVNSKIFFELEGFDENFPYPAMEDWDFHDRLQKASYHIEFVNDAVVNHPPRRRYWGGQYAKLLESHVYMWCKQKQKRPFYVVAAMMLIIRLRVIARYPFSKDFVIAILSLLVEALYLVLHIGGWERKYRRYFSLS